MRLRIGLCLLWMNCGGGDFVEQGTVEPPPMGEVAESGGPVSVLRPPYASIVQRPRPGCSEQSRIEAPDLDNTTPGEPLLVESFGPDGCVDERWVREWADGRLAHEVYDFFDPEIARYVYVEPTPYSHRWLYDAQGRVIRETRALEVDGEPFHGLVRVHDAQGREIELVRTGEGGAAVQRERWTYQAISDEFATYELSYQGRVSQTERRVFDAAGRTIEVHTSVDGRSEQLTRRVAYVHGRIAQLWTWDRHTGAPESEHDYERREDGTLQREVVRNLRTGWLDVREFDAAERPVLYTQDEDRDGRIEYREVYRYDDAGNLVFASTEYDFDAPTPRYSEVRATFDEQGRMVESVRDQPWMQGTPRRTRVTYDADGHTVVEELIDRAGAVVRVDAIARYLDAERLAWRRADPDQDGSLNMVEVRHWSDARPLETLWDYDDDGVVDALEQWLYDRAEQLVAHSVDDDADGFAEAMTLIQR